MKLKSIEQIKKEFKHSHNPGHSGPGHSGPGPGIDFLDGRHINEWMIHLFDKEYKNSDFKECDNKYDYEYYDKTKKLTWYFSKDWFETEDFIKESEFMI